MAEKKKSKLNIPKDTILIFVAIAAIIVYIVFHVYSATKIDLDTVTAVESTVYETIEAKALVIRDEQLINTRTDALTVACVSDGEKVGVNGNIAMTFASKESAADYAKLKELHNQLDYYIDLQNRKVASVTDYATLERDTISDINSYVKASSYGKISSLSDYRADINDKLTRHQMLIGEKIDFSAKTTELEAQINSINSNAATPQNFIKTDKSGVFSSYLDGLETTFDYGKVQELDVQTLENYINQAESNKPITDGFGKLINSYTWYMCCVLDAKDVLNLQNGQQVNVAIKDSDEVMKFTIVSGAEPDLGVEKTVLILQSSNMSSSIAAMRLEDIELRCKSYTGFKLPSSSIHIDEDGNKCVYALVNNKVQIRHSEIIYSTKDFAVFRNRDDEQNPIRYYDQIITKGKDLHDGQDYSG